MELTETTVTSEAGVVPKLTLDPGVNPAPEMVTLVPPVAGPDDGVSIEISGAYENRPALTGLPRTGVTETCTVPDPGGAVATSELLFASRMTEEAGVVPKLTLDPGAKPEPEMVTLVPPVAGPDDGASEVTEGE